LAASRMAYPPPVVIEVDVDLLARTPEGSDLRRPGHDLVIGKPACRLPSPVHTDVSERRGGDAIGFNGTSDRHAECHRVVSQLLVYLAYMPAGVSELDHPAAILRQYFQEGGQTGQVDLLGRRELA